MVLSLVPACATFPDDRLLYFAGFGGMGLMAQFLAAVWQRVDWVPSSRIRRLPLAAAFWLLVVFHLVLSPLSLAATSNKVRAFGEIIKGAASTLPSDLAGALEPEATQPPRDTPAHSNPAARYVVQPAPGTGRSKHKAIPIE